MSAKTKIDALLEEWPSPARADAWWDERADAIVKKAMSAPKDEAGATALMAAPSLAREANEPGAELVASAGEKKMSDDQSGIGSGGGGDSQSGTPSVAPKRKQSLKEIAERASQSGMARASNPPTATPVPSGRASSPASATPIPSAPATSTPLPKAEKSDPGARASRPAVSTPIPSRPAEAGKDDSGVVDLATIRETATAAEKAAAEKARPATEGLFEDDDDKAKKPAAVKTAAAAAAAAPAKKGSGGAIAGIAIAVVGLAAAFAVYKSSNTPPPPAPIAAAPEKPAAPPAGEAPAATSQPAEAPAQAAEAPAPEATADPAAPKAPEAVAANGAQPAPGGAPGAPPKPGAPTAAEPAKPGAAPVPPAAGGVPGDLNSEMAKAVDAKKAAEAEKAEPASGPGKSSNSSTIPEQPPQGSVQAAVRSVSPGAKACVAGADDISRAQITFGSNGAVTSVSVSGWAAGKPAAACIKAALKGANVGPFSKGSYSVGVPIRP